MLKITTYATGSKGNMYLLQNDETKVLLECGVKPIFIRNMLGDDGLVITDLDGCVITHCHSDHALSVEYVSDYIKTYGTNQLKAKCNKIHAIKQYQPFKIKSIMFYPVPVEHGNAENNAFIILDKDSCIFFGTDFSLMMDKLENSFNKIYIECNYEETKLDQALQNINDEMHEKYMRQLSTHLSLENCIEHLAHFNLEHCNEIHLIHKSSNKDLINPSRAVDMIKERFKIDTIFERGYL